MISSFCSKNVKGCVNCKDGCKDCNQCCDKVKLTPKHECRHCDKAVEETKDEVK